MLKYQQVYLCIDQGVQPFGERRNDYARDDLALFVRLVPSAPQRPHRRGVQLLKYLSMLVTGYAIYCAAVSFMGGDIASGVYYSFLSVADGIACCCAWRAQRSRREWNATEAALEAGLAESQQQLQVRIDEALKRAADQTAWQIESAAARAVVDDSFGYDADTRDGISEIALSVGDLREADDQTLMDELGACGLSPESLSPEATRLTPHEQQTFRDLTRSLGQPE